MPRYTQARMLAVLVLAGVAAHSSAAAEEVPASLPEGVTVRLCSVAGQTGLIAMRKLPDGSWQMLGTMRDYSVTEVNGRFTILMGEQVAQIWQGRIAILRNGEAATGQCSRAELEIDSLLADIR
jgi:hypothetical protein